LTKGKKSLHEKKDGGRQLEDESGAAFDEEALKKTLEKLPQPTSGEINDYIMSQLERHKGDRPYLDDIALLSIRFL